jgi:HlyD family secretion protein
MRKIWILAFVTLLISCSKKEQTTDASGTFEAVETIVSAEATGDIVKLDLEEGQVIKAGARVGTIDTTQLYLKKIQLQAQIAAVLSRKPNVGLQLAAYREQLKQAQRERDRIASLLKGDAATPKQLDDANAQTDIIRRQISAQQSALEIATSGIGKEALPLEVQIRQLDDQIAKSEIVNKVDGTVLTKYVELHESAVTGKPLYKIADLSTILLRAYITGDQLSTVKPGMKVRVLVDAPGGKYKEYQGLIQWISDKAEFTPKTIQTKEERANLVYALKVKLKNDGFLKIGMYAELSFDQQ